MRAPIQTAVYQPFPDDSCDGDNDHAYADGSNHNAYDDSTKIDACQLLVSSLGHWESLSSEDSTLQHLA